MGKRILWLTDADPAGSGYTNLSSPICNGLTDLGHEIKMVGISYRGQEHWNKFSIIPAVDFADVMAIMQNMILKWNFDILVVALDIPHQEKLINAVQSKIKNRTFKYIGIFPIEAGPLCMSWAMSIMGMNKQFIISKYGTEEAHKMGVPAEHLQIGIDTTLWRLPQNDERKLLREALGFDEDTFVVLTVADNQERKNLHKAMETYAEFAKGKKCRYVLVTREWNPAGGRLKDYAQELGITKDFMMFERGAPLTQLWALYIVSDVFLLTSKAEGAGLPIFEAMAVGLPVVATNCTAITELLENDRGFLVDYEYTHRDCFGNGWRYWFSQKHGVYQLEHIYKHRPDMTEARKFVEARTWDIPVKQLDQAIEELTK